MNAKGKITKARAGLILDLPFFGSLALRLEVVEDATCETAWTDGRRMGYNPGFIDSLPLAEVKGLICHEVMHCAAAHQARRGDRDHRKWNMAGDYAINQIIEDCKIPLPEGKLLDPAYTGMSAEAIYSKLPAHPPTPSKGGEMSPAGGGAGGGNSPLEGAGGGNPPAEKGNQPGGTDPGRCGEVRDAENPQSATGNQQSEQDWKIAVAQAAQEARMQGQLPASIARMVADVLEPKADWREILRRFV
ncbi:MAG: hypothetical protein Q8P12_01895, partial [bacterium]|nr:hypothetical protein [bacterium]